MQNNPPVTSDVQSSVVMPNGGPGLDSNNAGPELHGSPLDAAALHLPSTIGVASSVPSSNNPLINPTVANSDLPDTTSMAPMANISVDPINNTSDDTTASLNNFVPNVDINNHTPASPNTVDINLSSPLDSQANSSPLATSTTNTNPNEPILESPSPTTMMPNPTPAPASVLDPTSANPVVSVDSSIDVVPQVLSVEPPLIPLYTSSNSNSTINSASSETMNTPPVAPIAPTVPSFSASDNTIPIPAPDVPISTADNISSTNPVISPSTSDQPVSVNIDQNSVATSTSSAPIINTDQVNAYVEAPQSVDNNQVIEDFCNSLLVEKGYNNLEPDKLSKYKSDLMDELEDLTNTTIVNALDDSHLEEFESKLDAGLGPDELMAYVSSVVPSITNILSETYARYRQEYLKPD